MLVHGRHQPFQHAIFVSFLSADFHDHLIDVLDGANWEARHHKLYRFDVPACRDLNGILLDRVLDNIQFESERLKFGKLLGCRLRGRARLDVHRYNLGDGIRPHTDLGTNEVRFVLSINRNWAMEDGGIWVLAADETLSQSTTFVPSISNTGFAFAAGRTTFHALSSVNRGPLYGLAIKVLCS